MPGADITDGLEAQLVLGLLEALDAWELLTWSADAAYAPTVIRPAFIGPDEPANAPAERVIVTPRTPRRLTVRTVDVPVGINYRGPEDGDELGGTNYLGQLRRRLYRLPARSFGAVRVNGVRIQDEGPIGRDSRRRVGATATYLFRCREALVNV